MDRRCMSGSACMWQGRSESSPILSTASRVMQRRAQRTGECPSGSSLMRSGALLPWALGPGHEAKAAWRNDMRGASARTREDGDQDLVELQVVASIRGSIFAACRRELMQARPRPLSRTHGQIAKLHHPGRMEAGRATVTPARLVRGTPVSRQTSMSRRMP